MSDSAPSTDRDELRPKKPVAVRRNLKMIQRGSLLSALDLAICRALEPHGKLLGPRRVEAIRDKAQRDFLALVRSNVRKVRGMSKSEFLTELERSRDRILLERNKAVDELAKLSVRAEAFRKLKEAEERARKQNDDASASLHENELRAGLEHLFRQAAAGNLDLASLREEVLALAAHAAQEERERLSSSRSDEYQREVDVFQRRIAKLNLSLSESESALHELARLKGVDPGVSSVFRTVQGLSAADAQLDLKRELLLEIFEANRMLRQGKAESPA